MDATTLSLPLHKRLNSLFTRRKSSTSSMPTDEESPPSSSRSSRRSSWIPHPPTRPTNQATPCPKPRKSRIPSMTSHKRLPRSDTEPLLSTTNKENRAPQPPWPVTQDGLLDALPPCPSPTSSVRTQFRDPAPLEEARPTPLARSTTTFFRPARRAEEQSTAYWTGRLLSLSDRRLAAQFDAMLADVDEFGRCDGEDEVVHRRAVLGALYASCRDEGAREALRAYCEELGREGWDVVWSEMQRMAREMDGVRRGFMGRLLGLG